MTPLRAAAAQAAWLSLSGNVRGAVWMIASGLGFTVMALLIKPLGDRLDSFQIAFFRCLIGLLAILPLVAGYGLAALRTRALGIHLMRGMLAVRRARAESPPCSLPPRSARSRPGPCPGARP